MTEIYFDCASTTRPEREVLDVFQRVSLEDYANAASTHAMGNRADRLLEKARSQVASYFSLSPQEVIFTSGATEGNNLAIKGVAYHCRSWGRKLITTKAEHPSVLNVFRELEKEGFQVVYLDYGKDGRLDIEALESSLDEHVSLVAVMAVNNETGYVFDTKKVYDIVHAKSRAKLLVDATQAIGKESLSDIAYDLLTFSGHKIGGLKGSGALLRRKDVQLDAQILGGGQESGYRSGTAPVPLDCSLATALRLALRSLPERRAKAKALNSYLRDGLSKIDEVLLLSDENATPFILSFALREHKGSIVAEALSNMGIYVSTKSACSSREEGVSYVIQNAGYPERIARNAIRLSFSGKEDLEEGRLFLEGLGQVLDRIRKED